MRICLALIALVLFSAAGSELPERELRAKSKVVYVLPIRADIASPMVYLVRRGVKEAMEAKADVLILDMNTNGGLVEVTDEIIEILDQFKGLTVTYVNDRAFSAGAFISVATQKIYMAPGAVIGAAAPIMMVPGAGPQQTPETMEVKMTSAVRALVRRAAEKNGHNVEVVEAMIDKNKELIIDGTVLNRKGDILTLTDTEARKPYGNPPKPLLSSGTVDSIEALMREFGYEGARRVEIKPTGAESFATWINKISPLLLIVGIVGIYLEMKTPGFGLPGIVGIVAIGLYFLGGYVAGLSGLEWLLVFILGLALLVLELFIFPGTFLLGVAGVVLMLVAIVMGMVDLYPGSPALPKLPQLEVPLRGLAIALLGSAAGIFALSRLLPKTAVYDVLVSQSSSGEASARAQERQAQIRLGRTGVTISTLRPGGKARFGDEILDVISQGELIPKGAAVRIIGSSGPAAIVETVQPAHG